MPDLGVGHLWANCCKLVHSFISKMLARLLLQPAMAAEKKNQTILSIYAYSEEVTMFTQCQLHMCSGRGTERGKASRESEWYYWEGYFYSLPESAESAVNNKHHRRVMTAEDLSPTVRCCKVWMPVRPLLFWLCSKKNSLCFVCVWLIEAIVYPGSFFFFHSLEEKQELNWGFPSSENSHEGNQSHSQWRLQSHRRPICLWGRRPIAFHGIPGWG